MQIKSKIIGTAVAIVMCSTAAFAQSEQPNVVRINPLGAFIGLGNISYERAISNKSSFVISPTFGFFKIDGDRISLFGVGAEYRYYFTGLAPEGTYFAPGVGFVYASYKEDTGEKVSGRGLTTKLVIGHQWIWKGGFTLDLNGGISYVSLKGKEGTDSFNDVDAVNGILPALAVGIGYNF